MLRATADLDTVTDYRYSPTALEILQRRADSRVDPADPHTITLAGTEIQFQDVVAVTDAEIEHLEPKNLLYVAGHAHSLTTATIIRIRATGVGDPVEASVPVATTGALVAMKLHAYLDRRGTSGPDKRPGDLLGPLQPPALLRFRGRTRPSQWQPATTSRRGYHAPRATCRHVAADLLQRILD